jgi:hypothetical protein
MAKRVDNFPELPSQSRYPWDEWLDGSVWELIPGQDFSGKPANFRSVATGQAKKRNGKVKTRLLRADGPEQTDRLYVQFEQNGRRRATRGA